MAGPDPTAQTPAGTGRVEATLTSLTSGPTQMQSMAPGKPLKVKQIIVTVAKVTAHSSSAGWVTLVSKETEIDVLQLAKYTQPLGFANMPAGKVTQVRLYLAENKNQYVVRDDGVRVDLKVPSGLQSGIKLHGMFDVDGCALTSVPLQFDGKKSIWVHPNGQGDEWILRPVIRTGKIEASTVGCTPPPNTQPNPPGTLPIDVPQTPVTPRDDPFNEGPGNGYGGACATGLQCLSGVCTSGTCGKGGADAPCGVALDCSSGVCGTTGTCGIGKAGGTGSVCTANVDCLSNGCVNGTCGQGGQGQPCAVAGDCAIGFQCTSGACASPIN